MEVYHRRIDVRELKKSKAYIRNDFECRIRAIAEGEKNDGRSTVKRIALKIMKMARSFILHRPSYSNDNLHGNIERGLMRRAMKTFVNYRRATVDCLRHRGRI